MENVQFFEECYTVIHVSMSFTQFHLLSLLFVLQNSKSIKQQVKHFVYCMENAILNLPPHQEQVVWLIDFQGFNLSNISFKLARETVHVLQEYYPERLGLSLIYNAPWIFQPFLAVTKSKSLLLSSGCGYVISVYDHGINLVSVCNLKG